MKKTVTLFIILFACSSLWVSAQKNWMEGWDGGSAMGPGSEPNQFGWICDKADFDGWDVADSEIAGRVRYSTKLASQCAIFDSVEDGEMFPKYYDNNRLLIIRWDGIFVNYYAYKLEGLTAGKTYKFSWVYAWYDNASRCELRVGVNKNPVSTITDNTNWQMMEDVNDDVYYQYFFEIMDDLKGPNDNFPYEQKKTVHPSEFEFTVPADGDYYMTFTCTHVVAGEKNEHGSANGPMAMVGGFSVTESGSSSINSTTEDNLNIRVEGGKIVVDGAENFTVTSITGQNLNPASSLNSGVYVVGVNGKAHKIIVK